MHKKLKMAKKIIAMIMVFCMVFGMVPAPASAAMVDELGGLFKTSAETDSSPKVTLKLEGYEVMADAESITLSGEDCKFDFVADNESGIYTAMNAGSAYKVTGKLLPDTQYYLRFNFQSASGADWSTLTKDDVALEGLCDTADDLTNQYTFLYKNMVGWFKLPMLEIPADANVETNAENGKVYPSTYNANAGDTVSLTFAPDDNYVLDTVTVTDANGNAVEVSESYTFTMPDTAVTVFAQFAKTKAVWTMGNASGKPGETVQVTMSLESDVATYGRFYFRPTYDQSVLSYETNTKSDITLAADTGFTSITQKSATIDDVAWNYYYTSNNRTKTPQGVIFTINYKIAEDAIPGEYPITLADLGNKDKNGTYFYIGKAVVDCDYSVVPGVITVEDYGIQCNAITISETENGTVTADKAEAADGETVTLTVTPDEGYELDTLTVTDKNGNAVTVTDNTFTMPGSAVTVSATFLALERYNITISESENGTVTADKETAYKGQTVTLTATPAKGYKLDTLTVTDADGNAVTVTNNTFTMPAKAVKVNVTFVADPYPYRMNLKISGYEIGKVAKYATVKMYDTNGNDVTAGEWYCCIVDSNEGCNWNIGELKADTRYWLRIERYISGYSASDFGLLDMDAVSVTDSSGGGNFLIYIELPMLEAPAPTTYAVTVNAAENGTVTSDKAEAIEGETVTLTVAPDEGYELETLTVGEQELTKVNGTTYTFVMPAKDVSASASFKLLPVTYAVNVSEMLGGTVTADKAKAAEGDTVTLTVKADDYYEYEPDTLSVTDAAGNEVTVTDNTFTMPAGAVTVSATFKQTSGMEQYFTVTVDGVEYTAQYIGKQEYDEQKRVCEAFKVELPAGTTDMTVDSDYKLYVSDMGNWIIAKGDDPINLPVNGAVTTYKLNSYLGTSSPHHCYLRVELPSAAVTVNEAENGKVEADKTIAAKGETVALTVTPNKGYMLDILTVTDAEGNEVTVAEDYTFAMPETAVTVKATFKEIPPITYAVILNASENGTVTADKEEAKMGDTVQLTVTPAEGYELKSLTVLNSAGAKVAVAEDYSFVMPGSVVDVTAVFKKASTAKVTFNLEGYESGSKTNAITVTAKDANGADITSDWSYWGIFAKPSDYGTVGGNFQNNTEYWLKCETTSSKYRNYTVDDYALEGLEATDVQYSSDSQYNYYAIYFKLPVLKETYRIYTEEPTTIQDGSMKVYVDGKEVDKASAGDTVTLVFTPNDGFVLGEVCVMDRYAAVIPSVMTAENTYTFVMPENWVWFDVVFRQVVADDKSTITLGDQRDVHPGDKVYIPVTVENPPAGGFYIFDMSVFLPDGWKIEEVLQGKDSHLNSTDYWHASIIGDGQLGMVAQGASSSLAFPDGEIMILGIRVSSDATPGTYKLDLNYAGLSMGRVESVKTIFGQHIDGYVTVKAAPEEKIKLDAPVISEGMIIAYEDLIESRNIPASSQETNAIVEYRLAEDKASLETAEWIEGVVPANIDTVTEDTVRWITDVMPQSDTGNVGNLKAGTKYILQIRYKADNANVYTDSDPIEMEVTTKSWIETPVEISTSDAVSSPGESFTVKVSLDHAFGDMQFIEKNLNLSFNSDVFTLTNFTKTNFDGKTLNKGEVAELTFTVNKNAEPGVHQLELTESNPIYLRYNRDGSGYYGHNREYPVNVEFVSGSITVKAPMEAPVLADAEALADSITVTPPATVSGVKVEYSISTDGVKWSEWQESNVFTGLDVNTEYQIRARYVPDGSEKYGPSEASKAIKVTTNYDDITFTLGDAVALPGETVTIPVTVAHELTKEATSLMITPTYKTEELSFDSVALGESLADAGWKVLNRNGVVELFKTDGSAFAVPEGTVLNLTFKVVKSGDLKVGLTAEIYNGEALMGIESEVAEGTVHGHNKVVVDGKAATCHGEGLTDGAKCSLCDEILTEQTVIEALGHDLKETVVAPTHSKMGYTLVECERCDYALVKDFTDAVKHDYKSEVTKEATCTAEGEMTFTCTDATCGATYTQVIPKAEHKYVSEETKATCTAMGYTTYDCENCDHSYMADIIAALGHDCETTVTDPTCESIGYTTYDCKNCDHSYVNDVVAALGHTETVKDAKEATHDDAGYTGDTVCDVCGDLLKQGEKIAALGCPAEAYSDVDTSKWYHSAIDYVLMNKLMHGVGNDLFAPNDNTTRAMLATLLYRMAGEPSVDGMENPFTDVKAGTWYSNAIIWAANEGVVSGTSATTFDPDAKITREQMVTMIWRYAGEPEGDASVLAKYDDADKVSDYAKEAMAWAIEKGIVTGVSDSVLSPQNTATRAQIAAILMRYCEM